MIIDIHTHTFPEKIAKKALDKLSESSNMPYFLNGSLSDLQRSMEENGIDYSVLLPVATSPSQYATINQTAIEINDRWQETGILSFGGIHPCNDNYKEIINHLCANGIRGIKIHPVFQDVPIDDIRYLRLISYASERGLVIVTHAGFDIGFPGIEHSIASRISSMLRQIKPEKMVLAHMGGWGDWDNVEELLCDYPVWMDTAFTLPPIAHLKKLDPQKAPWKPEQEQLTYTQFHRIVDSLGARRILFGSDSPWSSQGASLTYLKQALSDTPELYPIISGKNAATLLGINGSGRL